jgi:hypothetical protein
MSTEELSYTLDELPKRLHDLYGFEILGGESRPLRLQIGRAVRGTYATILIGPDLEVSVSNSHVTFSSAESSVTISRSEYHVEIANC